MQYLIKTFVIFLVLSVSKVLIADDRGIEIFNKSASGVVVVMGKNKTGSGVVITQSGHVLTNWHVIDEEKEITIAVYGENSFEKLFFKVKVLKFDKEKDLALLKIINPPRGLHHIQISQILPLVGSEVHAIGHPKGGMDWTYTMGYISQFRKDFQRVDKENQEHTYDVYQIQTPLHPGNSGGPLLNKYGNLVGINTFGSSEKGSLNFAVTAAEVIRFLKE
jgi:S1-C subfamily serine protease